MEIFGDRNRFLGDGDLSIPRESDLTFKFITHNNNEWNTHFLYIFSTYNPPDSEGTSRQAFQLSPEQIKLVSGSERPKRPTPPKLKFTRAGNLSALMDRVPPRAKDIEI